MRGLIWSVHGNTHLLLYLRKLEGGFPVREVVEVPIADLPADDAELALPQLLDERIVLAFDSAQSRHRWIGHVWQFQPPADDNALGFAEALVLS